MKNNVSTKISSIPRDPKVIIAEKWKEAVRASKVDLARVSEADYKKIQGFDSAEALLEDLGRMKELNSPTWISNAAKLISILDITYVNKLLIAVQPDPPGRRYA